MAWGLRGHEQQHPDSEKIYVELDRASIGGRNVRGGLAGLGYWKKFTGVRTALPLRVWPRRAK
jgi:hypothetical protein